ncbi:MAG: protocatechuate 3,4-dioxygenase subunit alpha [Pseudomonadota bacterium]
MSHDDDILPETPSQTAGPYVHIGLAPNAAGIEGVYGTDLGFEIAGSAAQGERIEIVGAIRDGFGSVIKDALIEVWQADHEGLYPGHDGGDPALGGWGRVAADQATGAFRISTIKPGSVRTVGGQHAPHLTLWIVARGINLGLHTRIYFDDEDAANAADPLLSRIEHKGRIQTLLARQVGNGKYQFDIHLQGPDETIFFDI